MSVGPPNKSLEPTLLSRILLRLVLPSQRFKSSLVTLRQPQGDSAPPLYERLAPLRCAHRSYNVAADFIPLLSLLAPLASYNKRMKRLRRYLTHSSPYGDSVA